jgi:hypothetical protein
MLILKPYGDGIGVVGVTRLAFQVKLFTDL